MPKLSINILGWNTSHEILEKSIRAALQQEFDDYEVIFSDNGSSNGSLEFVRSKFAGAKNFKIVDNQENLGYAGGHNKFFAEADSEFLMVLNPDTELDQHFAARILESFQDPMVGCATGKMFRPYKGENGKQLLDGTGIVLSRARAGRERGQLQEDFGQYDSSLEVFGVSGSAAAYRKLALEKVRLYDREYFDTDFFMYWEDLDLSWRLRLAGFKARYVPEAVVYHVRFAGKAKRGYKDLRAFIRHHRQLPDKVVQWNWRNHLFAIIKNDFGWPFWRDLPLIFFREFAMLIYILAFERRILRSVPVFFKLLPKMLDKRKIIQSRRAVSSAEARKWFV